MPGEGWGQPRHVWLSFRIPDGKETAVRALGELRYERRRPDGVHLRGYRFKYMSPRERCRFNSYLQASQTIKSCKIYNIDPILYIKYFIINGFSPSWVEELNNLLVNIFGKKKFEFCIDCRNNYSLFIDL